MKHLLTLTLLAALSLNVSCASKEEKEERRQNAYDVSGSYRSSKEMGSEVDIGFVIRNESGRHDIVAEYERLSPITEKEKTFFREQGLDVQKTLGLIPSKMTLGRGYNKDHLEGGENISDNFGESSRFFICSPSERYDSETQIYYCLKGIVTKKSKKMEGELVVRIYKEKTVKGSDGKPATKMELAQTSLKFGCNLEMVFFKQYLGYWNGEVFTDIFKSLDSSPFRSVTISLVNSESQFVVKPAADSLTVSGETFTYNTAASTRAMEELRDPEFPVLLMVFNSPSGKRLIWQGEIWSLGNLTGSIMVISGQSQNVLADFRMKKP